MFSISKRPTITEIHELYLAKKATVTQVTQFFINRSKEIDRKINAFYKLTEDLALKKSSELDQIIEQNTKNLTELFKKQPLFGVPFSIKSIIQIEGEIFNAGSKLMNNFRSPYSSTVVQKILDSGAVLLGINNMDQFAMGSSGENSDYGVTRNPFDTDRIPGGSSSGPIAAVASGQVVFSLGTDTGGSIRQPSAFCDVVGLKPTYGLVSRWGVMPMASSFDQVGGITNTVEDNIIVNKTLAGKDPKDQTSIDSQELKTKLEKILENKQNKRFQKTITKTPKPLKIGIPKEFYIDGIDPTIRQALTDLQNKLKNIGHQLIEVSLPLNKYAISVYYMTMSVEVASNLERLDGVRYAAQDNYKDLFFEHREKYFGDEPKRRIMLGTYASSAGYYDAYYNRAQKVKELARQSFDKAFETVDILLTPTTPEFPFKIGEKTSDPLKMYLSDVFTCGINPVRIPGLAVPLGLFPVRTGGTTQSINQEELEELQKQADLDSKKIVIGGIIVNDNNQVFVQKRSENRKLFPNCWDISAGGRLNQGESIYEALAREIKEETGWKLTDVVSLVDSFDWETDKEGSKVNYREFDFIVRVEGDLLRPTIETDNVSETRWVDLNTLDIVKENRENGEMQVYDILKKALQMNQNLQDMTYLPTGCQLLGPELSEDVLYQLAEEIEMIVKEDKDS